MTARSAFKILSNDRPNVMFCKLCICLPRRLRKLCSCWSYTEIVHGASQLTPDFYHILVSSKDVMKSFKLFAQSISFLNQSSTSVSLRLLIVDQTIASSTARNSNVQWLPSAQDARNAIEYCADGAYSVDDDWWLICGTGRLSPSAALNARTKAVKCTF